MTRMVVRLTPSVERQHPQDAAQHQRLEHFSLPSSAIANNEVLSEQQGGCCEDILNGFSSCGGPVL